MIREAIAAVVSGRSLTMEEAASVMEEIMEGEVTPAQFGAFVTALRLKGETVDEITGLARMMRAKAIPVTVAEPVVDTCGTLEALALSVTKREEPCCFFTTGFLPLKLWTIWFYVGLPIPSRYQIPAKWLSLRVMRTVAKEWMAEVEELLT